MQEEYKKFYDYLVYRDGRVYSLLRNKFLKPDIVQGYKQYTLSINGKPKKYKAHRLVAFFFCDPPDNYKELVVNHKDGNKLNNTPENLEWCTQWYNNYHARINGLNNISESNSKRWDDTEFRKRTSKHFSEARLRDGSSKGEKNGRFRYRIYDKYGKLYNRHTFMDLLGYKQSTTDAIIAKLANNVNYHNKIIDEYGIYVVDIKKGQSTIENSNGEKAAIV